jgi:hypothetical protein
MFLSAALAGCAADRGPLKLPDPIPLIAPEPGKAVVYLLRVPHEPFELVIRLDGTRIANLPKETFTAVSLLPGKYELLAAHPNAALASLPAIVTLSAGERRFLYSSVPTKSQLSTTFVPVGPGVIPIFTPVQVSAGGRRWTELSEFDAQGMFSILRAVAAETFAP